MANESPNVVVETNPGNTSKNWLTANENNLADLYSISQCMCLCDICGDGENNLIVADLTDHRTKNKQMKLKVYKGVNLIKETNIIDHPTGVVSFFLDQNEPRTPAIAVASGPYIYVYKNMKPYFKFTLPTLEVDEAEINLWKQFDNDEIDAETLRGNLSELRNTGLLVTSRSVRLIGLSQDSVNEFCNMYRNGSLKKQTVATCITTMKKSHSEVDAISCLVVGTEACQLFIIDPEAFTILFAITLDSVPVFLSAIGLYDVEFRLYIVCRNGSIYVTKRGDKSAKRIVQLNTQIIGMVRITKSLIVGCMDDTIRCYSPKGREVWRKQLPSSLISMTLFESDQHKLSGVIVSLNNSTLQIYKDRDLLETISVSDTVTGMLFGQFGREQSCLLMVTRNGSLIIKLLKRTADLTVSNSYKGPPQAQFEKLNIPKKTKLFIDQAFRERENAVAIHRKFMQDLHQLRILSARSYIDVLQNKQNPISNRKSDPIMVSVEVNGIGPIFNMKVILHNTSLDKPSADLVILFVYDHKIYSIEDSVIQVPFLIPGVKYPYSAFVECLNDKGVADMIKIMVLKNNESEPIVTAVVNMPVSETFLGS